MSGVRATGQPSDDPASAARSASAPTRATRARRRNPAARAAGVSAKTVYNHQDSDPAFAEDVRTALAMSATPVEMLWVPE